MMEEPCGQDIERGMDFLKEAKVVGLDEDFMDVMLPLAVQIVSQHEGEVENIETPRPSPPTPPIEEDFTEILKEDVRLISTKVKNASKEKKEDKKTVLRRLGIINDCSVPCLLSIKELRGLYEPRYKLNFTLKKKKKTFKYLSAYKRKWNLLLKLEGWENLLNHCSPDEPYISVENKVDNFGPPEGFVYISASVMPSNIDYLFDKDYLVGCSCVRCTPITCDCPKNSGGKFAYDRIGRVQFEPGKPIYECNSRCSCSVSCRNRVVQRGRTVRVTIFRTPNGCGWGVKTMDPILKHQFVTEYVGEVLTTEEAEERGKVYDHIGQTYLFDLDYNDGECAFTIDAKRYGNISHFINHSCDPNLSVFGVWVETLDPRMPKIAFFASRDIKGGEELTFDYLMTAGDSFSSSPTKSSSKKFKRTPCHCGAKNCRNYLF